MSEFYTAETIQSIREAELEMEQYQMMLDKYDPYADVDDEVCSYCEDEEVDCQECGGTDYDYLIDSYVEGSLFGWDS